MNRFERVFDDSGRQPDDELIDAALRALPELRLPASTRASIWARTLGLPARRGAAGPVARIGLALAAAACLSLSSVGAWIFSPARSVEMTLSEAELDRLDRDVRIAFSFLAHAIDRAEDIAVTDALIRGTVPAFEALPGPATTTP